MKLLIALILTCGAFSARAADVSGRAQLTLWGENVNGLFETDIRQEGTNILGNTAWGPNGLVNLQITNGHYKGWAGGFGATELVCAAGECKGQIGGQSADFSATNHELANGIQETDLTGSVNMLSCKAQASPEKIEVSGLNTLTLTKTSDGNYDGDAYFFGYNGAILHYTARLETSGTLMGLKDPALFAIFLVAPFNQH